MKGHIQKKSDKKWKIYVYLGTDGAGKKKYVTKVVNGTKRDAQRLLTQMLNDINQGTFTEPTKLTVNDYMARWLKDYASVNVALRTYEFYEQTLKLHINPRIGHIELSKLTPLTLQHYYSELLKGGKLDWSGKLTGIGLSPTTVLKHHRIIHEALDHAVKWGLVVRNVADMVEPPRRVKEEMKTWSAAEASRFLDTVKDHRHYAFYLTAVMTGMRLGELLGLRWSDVDLQGNTLYIQQTLLKGGQNPVYGHAKTEKSRRQIALPEAVVRALKQNKALQNQERLVWGSDYRDTGLVFTKDTGNHLDPTYMSRGLFKRLIAAAGVPDIRFHDLRHTHATLMLKNGVNPKVVSERLGHSGVQITLDTYSHVLPEMQSEAARIVEKSILES
jgi:integrase